MPVSEKEIIERLPDWIAEKKTSFLRFRDLRAGNAFDEHVSRQKRWFHGRRWSNV